MTADLGRPQASHPRDPWAEQVAQRWYTVQRLLRGIRRRLGLEIGFIAEFTEGERVFRFVDTEGGAATLEVDASDPLRDSYCHYVVTGRIPQLLRDAREHPFAASLPATEEFPVRTHVSVPIRMSDGRLYGTLCCFSRTVQPSINERDLHALRVVADLAAECLEEVESDHRRLRERRQVIETVLTEPGAIEMAFQPLVDLNTLEIVGMEALARFPNHPQPTDWFFREATLVGLGHELGMKAIRLALAAVPAGSTWGRLNLNVDPPTLSTGEFHELVGALPEGTLVVEVTEHALVEDYTDLRLAAHQLADCGVWLAIDDVGSGFSGLQRILELRPQQIKLDRALIQGLHRDSAKRALIEAFGGFGETMHVDVLAEGIEEAGELLALQELGIVVGQGYLLGRPGPLPVG